MRWLAVLVFVVVAVPVRAQPAPPPAPNAEAQAIFGEVMSPFCPGLTLADCPSKQAFDMRGDIEGRLANGESREAILDELVTDYGTGILADPSDTPIGRVVWGVPIVLSVLGAGALALFLRRVTRGQRDERPPDGETPAEARSRLDEELSALD